jgi:hypothetical protein
MAEYRTVRMSFWTDPYIEELDAKAKLLYLYLFTCPYTNNLGVVEVTRKKVSYETGLTLAEVNKHLDDFKVSEKIVCDQDHNLIFLVNFIRHQCSTSPKILDGLAKLAPTICSPIIAKALCIRYPEVYGVDRYPMDTVSIPYANGIHTLCIPSGEMEREREIGTGNLEDGKGNMEKGNGKGEGAPARKEPPEVKQQFGENGFVRLTPEENAKLCEKFGPEQTAKAIAFLDLHIGAKGHDPYKSHNLALQKWVFDAVREREAKQAAALPRGQPGNRRGQDGLIDEMNRWIDHIEEGEAAHG